VIGGDVSQIGDVEAGKHAEEEIPRRQPQAQACTEDRHEDSASDGRQQQQVQDPRQRSEDRMMGASAVLERKRVGHPEHTSDPPTLRRAAARQIQIGAQEDHREGIGEDEGDHRLGANDSPGKKQPSNGCPDEKKTRLDAQMRPS